MSYTSHPAPILVPQRPPSTFRLQEVSTGPHLHLKGHVPGSQPGWGKRSPQDIQNPVTTHTHYISTVILFCTMFGQVFMGMGFTDHEDLTIKARPSPSMKIWSYPRNEMPASKASGINNQLIHSPPANATRLGPGRVCPQASDSVRPQSLHPKVGLRSRGCQLKHLQGPGEGRRPGETAP